MIFYVFLIFSFLVTNGTTLRIYRPRIPISIVKTNLHEHEREEDSDLRLHDLSQEFRSFIHIENVKNNPRNSWIGFSPAIRNTLMAIFFTRKLLKCHSDVWVNGLVL